MAAASARQGESRSSTCPYPSSSARSSGKPKALAGARLDAVEADRLEEDVAGDAIHSQGSAEAAAVVGGSGLS